MKILGMRLNMMNKTPLFVCFDIVHHHLFSECPGFVQFKKWWRLRTWSWDSKQPRRRGSSRECCCKRPHTVVESVIIIKIVINIDWLNDLDKSQSCRPPSDSGLSWREREPTKPGPYRGIFSENILCLLFFLGLIKLACFHPALSTYIKRAVTDIGKVEHRAGIYLECPRRGCHHPPSPAFSWYELLPQCTQDSLVALSYCQELLQAKC